MKISIQDQLPETESSAPVKKPYASVYDWIEAAVFSLICVVLVFTFLIRIVGVKGDSMMNTLMENDRLILTSFPITPERGDIVVVNRYTKEPIIKRVIGVAGDRVYIDPEKQMVLLNGKELTEDYALGSTSPNDVTAEVTVPEGYVFVLGDNRVVSLDSRDESVGLVSLKDVMGKAMFRIWPVNEFGKLPSVKIAAE